MKAITHDLFSVGLGVYILSRIEVPFNPPYLVLTVWLALAINEVIDVLGHLTRSGARSFWTHSVFTAPVWGVAVALASAYVLDGVVSQAMTAPQELFAAGLGVAMAFSHLLLDSLTEGGVYLGRRRIAIAHMRYNNKILNGAFALLGVLMVFAALA